MRLETIVEYIELSLNFLLIVRLFSLHLGKVYAVFSAFLLSDLVASLAAGLYDLQPFPIDYRITYSVGRFFIWIFTVWVVYALLSAMLRSLPGILRYSKRLLHAVFAAASVVAVLVMALDDTATRIGGWKSALDRVVVVTYVVDQTVAITVLLVLIAMLGFFLWFPVVVPRNLVVFSIGYVVYFSSVTASLLLRNFRNSGSSPVISIILMLVTSVCYVYWAIFLSRAGEKLPVRVGHRWQPEEQQRLIDRLEEVNGVLLHTLANKKAV